MCPIEYFVVYCGIIKNQNPYKMAKFKDELYQLSESLQGIIKKKKRELHKTSDRDLEAYLEERVALERVASLLTTANYILDRIKSN